MQIFIKEREKLYRQKSRISMLCDQLRLSPYQAYILFMNAHKYNMDGLQKRGDILYAPYKCTLSHNTRDYVEKVFLGPRVDLVGTDRMLVIGKRGVRLYSAGFFKASDSYGHSYYADSFGQRIERSLFENILGI